MVTIYKRQFPYENDSVASVSIDKAGRIVIPKPVRDELRLEPGDSLELSTSGDQITLRPVREVIPIQKENGFWVYRSGQPVNNISIRDLIEEDRDERMRRILGWQR